MSQGGQYHSVVSLPRSYVWAGSTLKKKKKRQEKNDATTAPDQAWECVSVYEDIGRCRVYRFPRFRFFFVFFLKNMSVDKCYTMENKAQFSKSKKKRRTNCAAIAAVSVAFLKVVLYEIRFFSRRVRHFQVVPTLKLHTSWQGNF